MPAAAPNIIVATRDNFADVLEQSQRIPVLVDFWAGWCAPCQVLMPMLVALATEYQGQVLLAKVDTDAEQELATEWGIRSLPTVKLFKHGLVVEEFTGAQPESVIREIIERHIEKEADRLCAQALGAIEHDDSTQAQKLLEQSLALDPDHLPSKLTLAELSVRLGTASAAEKLLRALPLNQREDEAVENLLARVEFARVLDQAPDRATLNRQLAAQADDLSAHHQLGAHDVMAGDYAAALEHFLAIMSRDRQFQDELGRRSLLAVFTRLGDDHPLVHQYRRKMATLMY